MKTPFTGLLLFMYELFDLDEQLSCLYGIACGYKNFFDYAGHTGGNAGLHLHGFNDGEGLVFLDLIADLDDYLCNSTRDGSSYMALVIWISHGDLYNACIFIMVFDFDIAVGSVQFEMYSAHSVFAEVAKTEIFYHKRHSITEIYAVRFTYCEAVEEYMAAEP